MKFSRRLFAALLLALTTLGSIPSVWAFDIAIYYDPLSARNQKFLDNCRHGYYWGSRQADSLALFSAALHGPMETAYSLYRDMGVNKVMVNYIYPEDFDWLPFDSTAGIKVMNWNYPGPNA